MNECCWGGNSERYGVSPAGWHGSESFQGCAWGRCSLAGLRMRRRALRFWTRLPRRAGNFIDSADIYSRWVEGNGGGVSEGVIGRWMRSRGDRGQMVIATKVRGQMGPGPNDQGLNGKHIVEGLRGFASPPADGCDRPVPGALFRRGDADRRDVGCVRPAGAAGQSALYRLQQLSGMASDGGAVDERQAGPGALLFASAALQPGAPGGV